MPNFLKIVFIFLGISLSAAGQQYSFRYLHSYDQFTVNNDGNQVYCLFRVKESKTAAVYRKVFLNENLKPVDSVEYQVDGDPMLVASGDNDFYTFHVFETKLEKIQTFIFLITDKSGNVVYQFKKTAPDLITIFGKEVKLKNLSLNFIHDQNKEMLLIEFSETNGRFYPRLVAWDIKDGSIIWQSDITNLGFIRTTQSQVIGITKTEGATRTSYSINYIDKFTGKRTFAPVGQGRGQRSVDVVASNGQQVMIAGAEFEGNNKNSKLYMSMYDMDGRLLFDKMDTTDRMQKYKRVLLGSTFDKDGNLVLIGEGYKIDATRVVVSTAASIAIGVLVGGVAVAPSSSVDNRIDFITSAALSTSNGEVVSYKNFPVGPWYDFATFYSGGDKVLIGFKNKFLLYNVDEPNVPPSQFATLKLKEQLILTSFGPAVTYRDASRNRIVLEMLARESK